MAKSILQITKECYLCRIEAEKAGYYGELTHYGLHKHHVMFGHGNRKKAEHYGMWVYLCVRHHEYGHDAVHANRGVRIFLSKVAQAAFERKYSHEKFMEEFTKDWIHGEEDFPGWEWQEDTGRQQEETKEEITFIDTGIGELPF